MKGVKFKSVNVDGKVFIVTGSNAGIGIRIVENKFSKFLIVMCVCQVLRLQSR